jgi:hypothetical protein
MLRLREACGAQHISHVSAHNARAWKQPAGQGTCQAMGVRAVGHTQSPPGSQQGDCCVCLVCQVAAFSKLRQQGHEWPRSYMGALYNERHSKAHSRVRQEGGQLPPQWPNTQGEHRCRRCAEHAAQWVSLPVRRPQLGQRHLLSIQGVSGRALVGSSGSQVCVRVCCQVPNASVQLSAACSASDVAHRGIYAAIIQRQIDVHVISQ